MVSFGMLFAFALAITSRSLLLFAGSGPPSFTAITISRPIMVKILPFLASFFSFLCLILANLECPDMFILSFFSVSANLCFSVKPLIKYITFPDIRQESGKDSHQPYVSRSRLIFRASSTEASCSLFRWQILSFSLRLSMVRSCSSRITESRMIP